MLIEGSTMRHALLTILLLFVSLAASRDAHALAPSRHRALAKQSCLDAGFPRDFCRRVGVEAYLTDAREFDDPAAHAQAAHGESRCEGEDAAVTRLQELGATIHSQSQALPSSDGAEAIAVALGRALHTVQDNCAHEGMTNPQHAWYSIDDFCTDSTSSPDLQVEAVQCAHEQSDAVFDDFRKMLAETGKKPSSLKRYHCPRNDPQSNERNECDSVWLPSPIAACNFLGDAHDWDGVDQRWDNDAVVPTLRSALGDAMTGDALTSNACDERQIAAFDARPDIDIREGPTTCLLSKLVCLGKADEVSRDLFEEPEGLDLDAEGAGCSVGGRGSSTTALLLMLSLVALGRRSRRRKHRHRCQ
jgi:MYXO-CTERM domain-containing protein